MRTIANGRAVVILSANLAIATAWWPTTSSAWRAIVSPLRTGAPSSPDEIMSSLASLGLFAAVAWVGIATAVTVLAEAPGTLGRAGAAAAARLAPASLRRVVV